MTPPPLPAPPPVTCGRCHTTRVYRRVHTRVPGARPVEVGMCDCDWPTCQRDGCGKTLRYAAKTASRCPHCDGPLWQTG